MIEPNGDSYPTNPSLLQRLKDTEDQRSWHEFNDAYGKLIFGFSMKAGCTEDEAREVVQETMIAAAKHLPGFEYDPRVCSFKTWLLNLSNWRVQDQFRKRQSSLAHRPSDGSDEITTRTSTLNRLPDPAGPDLEAIWDREWHAGLLEAALTRVKPRVDPKHWQIFDLYVLQEWSIKDVARMLGVSAGQVYLIKHRIGGLVKKEVKRVQHQWLQPPER